MRLTGAASDDGVELGFSSLSGVTERRLLAFIGNFLPPDGDISLTSPLSTSCAVLELLRRGINPRLALPPRSVDDVSFDVTELMMLSSFVVVVAKPFCRLNAPADVSPGVANCLTAVRLTHPGVDGAGMDDDEDSGLADFALELLPVALAAAAALLPLRLSGWVLELMRRARPDRRALATPPPVVVLLAILLILVDDSARLGTDDDDEQLPSHTTPISSPTAGG